MRLGVLADGGIASKANFQGRERGWPPGNRWQGRSLVDLHKFCRDPLLRRLCMASCACFQLVQKARQLREGNFYQGGEDSGERGGDFAD